MLIFFFFWLEVDVEGKSPNNLRHQYYAVYNKNNQQKHMETLVLFSGENFPLSRGRDFLIHNCGDVSEGPWI